MNDNNLSLKNEFDCKFCKALRESTQIAPWANLAKVTDSPTVNYDDIHSQSEYFKPWEEDFQPLEDYSDNLSLDTGSELSAVIIDESGGNIPFKGVDGEEEEMEILFDMSYNLFMSNEEETDDLDEDDLSLNN